MVNYRLVSCEDLQIKIIIDRLDQKILGFDIS